jgi:O-methyltransferase
MGISVGTFYDEVAERMPGREFIFFNHGYAEAGPRAYAWVRRSDWRYRHHLSLVRRALRDASLRGKSVLEVGCGRGGNCYYLARYAGAAHVCGLDRSAESIRFCRRVHRYRTVSFVQGTADALPFGMSSFDAVLSVEAAHCYRDTDPFLGEVRRVLKPGGVFCIVDLWSLPILELDWARRERSLRNCGLVVDNEEDLSPQVLRAIAANQDFRDLVRSLRTAENADLVEKILNISDAFRWTLAAGLCRYRAWRLHKPVQAGEARE